MHTALRLTDTNVSLCSPTFKIYFVHVNVYFPVCVYLHHACAGAL